MREANAPETNHAPSARPRPARARLLACALAALLCLQALPAAALAAGEGAEPPEATAAAEQDVPAAAADADGLSIVPGPFRHDGDSFTFPSLTVTAPEGVLIESVTVQFTTAIETGDDVLFASDPSVDTTVGKTANRTATVDGGWTAGQWQAWLRDNLSVTMPATGSMKTVRMIVSTEVVDEVYDYNADNGHYYKNVAVASTWLEARDNSMSAPRHMGMQGYLVTVTSREESDFLTTLIDTNTWMGGTAEPTFGATPNDGIFAWNDTTVKSGYSFYWVTGPEATAGVDGGPLEICYVAGEGNAQVPASNPTSYFKFWRNEPNNCAGIGFHNAANTQASGEYCLHLYSHKTSQGVANTTGSPGFWNDYPNSPAYGNVHRKCFYVIEYGGMEGDHEDGGDTSAWADIEVDPQGNTLAVQASDITLGEALSILEDVNGAHLPGQEVRRSYVRILEDGTEQEAREEEVPFCAGTYRVTSTVRDATGFKMPQASATFEVRPAEVNLTGTLSKVYDGTPAFALANLGALELTGVLPAQADGVMLSATAVNLASKDVGETVASLAGAALVGEHAHNYVLVGVDPQDATAQVAATILPRNLVITTSASHAQGHTGRPLDSFEVTCDLAVWPGTGEWAQNMLAPGDEGALGEPAFSCARTTDGTLLDPASPLEGVYEARASFPALGAAGRAAQGADGAWDAGNYLVRVVPATVTITTLDADGFTQRPNPDVANPAITGSGPSKTPDSVGDGSATASLVRLPSTGDVALELFMLVSAVALGACTVAAASRLRRSRRH